MDKLKDKKIRNVAIIAHVDHGKTTLVDAILKQCHVFRDNEEEMKAERILDTGDLEREKGVTIMAKNISVPYKDYKINIVDTPGHADFGGEVERTLNMAEGCILVVDAQEGPMVQTRVVLQRALILGLKPIVVINKIDKKLARCEETLEKIQNLFLELASSEDQLDFPVLYAIAREGKVFYELPKKSNTSGDVLPLLETIIKNIPETQGDQQAPFQMQISSLEYDSHNGRYIIGKIKRGTVHKKDNVVLVNNDKDHEVNLKGQVKTILIRDGLRFKEVQEASVGEIVAISGIESTDIGSTLCDVNHPDPLPDLNISPPSIRVTIEPNSSPLVGKDGNLLTSEMIRDRLKKEADTNVNIKVEKGEDEGNYVFVRGEFQLSILIETLRREGFELQIGKPTVIFKEIDGKQMEPLEELHIEVPEEQVNIIIQELSSRNADMIDMKSNEGNTNFIYHILTRNLLGLRNQLFTQTNGKLIFNNSFLKYVPVSQINKNVRKGVIVSSAPGTSIDYSLNTIQERGRLFIGSGQEIYEGMIIGINKYDKDIEVNPCKGRRQSGVRTSHARITISNLRPPIPLTLDFAISFVGEDELIEITPHHLRLRKKYLSVVERKWSKQKNLTDLAKKRLGIKE